ncbi:MAG TPA: DoxX family protein [Acidimicrobiia bacterium]|jgi:uncharacterized membrane protein YphA (DoxX/SURF4 family)|nr:DoxX family protein [Acidimicrobiia bacterium]
MNTVVWIVQVVLALGFLMAGAMKLTQPRAKLAPQMGWVEDVTDAQVKGIGLVEVAAALGLVLPGATDIAPVLTPLAAAGLVIVMIGAAATHLRRHEPKFVLINASLLVLASIVAGARFGPYSF